MRRNAVMSSHVRFALLPILLLASMPLSAGTASDMATAIRENTLDRDECYRVRDLKLVKDDLRIFLTDGYLIFGKPIAGRRVAAVFTSQVENGDGEVILRPPNLAERRSLASFIGAPNLDDHFRAAVFLFTGEDYQELMAQIPNNPANQKAAEMGALLESQWTPTLRNISSSYDTRLALDLLNSPVRRPGLFFAVVDSAQLGNYNLFDDPENLDQMAAGQYTERNNRAFFDIWTQFPARAGKARSSLGPELSDFRIEAAVDADLNLSAVTRVKVKTAVDGMQVLPFDVAREMVVSEVKVNGRPAEVLKREAPKGNFGRGENDLFLVMPAVPLRAGVENEFEFHHSGKVIVPMGEHIFYVAARGNWYPSFGAQFATYDLSFRYPRDWELVTPGDVIEDRIEGDWRITRRRPSAPIRLAGFNLGTYAHAQVAGDGYVVDLYANRTLDPALAPRLTPLAPPPPVRLRGWTQRIPTHDLSPIVDPLARLERLASSVASALEFMASKFGPPALTHLTVSPIPGNFGQGYPGLIYLSTRSYINRSGRVPQEEDVFYDDLLVVHETAHQWWGAQVASASYRDDWLMEALANYSALMYLEKNNGAREIAMLLDNYRTDLLAKRDNGQPVDSAGPIVFGTRLETSIEPRAWRAITYGKGSWILQMLRQRMGDERFLSMLAEILKRYGRREITTEEFRMLAAEFLPPKSDDPKLELFFDQWVYGTGIPTLKLNYTIRGKAPSWKVVGTLLQSDVPEDFSVLVPVEIQTAPGKSITQWVRSASDPTPFTVNLRQQPLKVTLDPHHGVLRR
jgi:hypothetical protein